MHNPPTPIRRYGSQRGQAAVEFALSTVFVVFVVLFLWELMMLSYTYVVVTQAAKEGLRYAQVHGASNTVLCAYPCTGSPSTVTAAVQTVVINTARNSFHDVSGLTASVTYPDGSNAITNRVQIIVTYTYVPYATLGWSPPVISGVAEGRILN